VNYRKLEKTINNPDRSEEAVLKSFVYLGIIACVIGLVASVIMTLIAFPINQTLALCIMVLGPIFAFLPIILIGIYFLISKMHK
jgi:cation transporter-like permease